MNGETLSQAINYWVSTLVMFLRCNEAKEVLLFTDLKRMERICGSSAIKLFVALQILRVVGEDVYG